MNLIAILLLSQLSGTRQTSPVLAFPEPGLDDSAAYQGYQTRFYRDAAGNTVQIYIDGRSGRVVHLLADAENGSIGFTVRDAGGLPLAFSWDSADALVSGSTRTRSLEYRLVAGAPHVHLGWFLLGSMRVERDFQYWGRHRAPFAGPKFTLAEMDRLLTALGRLDLAERRRHLALVGAPNVERLRARLQPTITARLTAASWVARIVQPSFDGRDTLVLEIQTDPSRVTAARVGDSLSLRARSGTQVPFVVRIATSTRALTPLTREEIFSSEFLAFLAAAKAAGEGSDVTDSARIRARWLERQVRGVELLSSREKLMAGLPAYATYFGRDMLLSALMMRSIWRDEMSEFVIASALRKLSPLGQVSHEEALGGQAVREAAAEYAALMEEQMRAARSGNAAAADSLLSRAREVLRDHRRVRENYHMIDDEFQLAVLAARWLGDPDVSAQRKRAFLLDSSDGGGTRLERLLRELALVARMTSAYVADPVATKLVSFAQRDSAQWASASWRDSNAGYAGGRFAMDVNAIWVPHALDGMRSIFHALHAVGFSVDSLASVFPELSAGTAIGGYARDSVALQSAITTWSGAWRHFLIRLGPAELRTRVSARLSIMPEQERAYWTSVLARTAADRDSIEFLALSLDANGRPIAVANSDPATRLFLGEIAGTAAGQQTTENVLRDVRLFVRPYPVGLFIEQVGPVVANDAYAQVPVWLNFRRDHYHGPRVVWGREINLFALGVANRIADARDPELSSYVPELRDALTRVLRAVEASGFQSELWSYEIREERLVPIRYGTGSDVQLWSTTDLAVQFALSRLGR